MSSIVITWKGETYIITKDEEVGESETEFRNRAWWIVKHYTHKNVESISELVALSHIWSSVKNYKVKYSAKVMQKLDALGGF